MRIAELGESKTLRWFAVGFFEEIADRVRFGAMGQERRELVDNADAERHSGDSQERPSIYLVFHFVSPFQPPSACRSRTQAPAAAL